MTMDHQKLHDLITLFQGRGAATVFYFFFGGGAKGDAIEVGTIQAVVKKSSYLTNTLLGEFKNIT